MHFPNTTTLQHTKQISSQVRLWKAKHKSDSEDIVTCAHVTRFEDSEDDVLSDIYAVSLQSNAEMFAAGSLSGFAHLVNVETGKRIARLDGHTAAVTGSCFCRQTSNMVVTSSNDTTVRSISFNKNHIFFFFSHQILFRYVFGMFSAVRVYRKYHMLRRLRLCLLVEIIS